MAIGITPHAPVVNRSRYPAGQSVKDFSAEEDLFGVWIGLEEAQLTFTRLDLRANSMGYCARISGNHPEVYQIRKKER